MQSMDDHGNLGGGVSLGLTMPLTSSMSSCSTGLNTSLPLSCYPAFLKKPPTWRDMLKSFFQLHKIHADCLAKLPFTLWPVQHCSTQILQLTGGVDPPVPWHSFFKRRQGGSLLNDEELSDLNECQYVRRRNWPIKLLIKFLVTAAGPKEVEWDDVLARRQHAGIWIKAHYRCSPLVLWLVCISVLGLQTAQISPLLQAVIFSS